MSSGTLLPIQKTPSKTRPTKPLGVSQVNDHADARESKDDLREEKERRAREWPKTRFSGARAHVWKFFRVYDNERMPYKAICNICLESGDYAQAEVSYGKSKSSSNLLSHLNCARRPSHRAAYKECLEMKGIHVPSNRSIPIKLKSETELPDWIRPLGRFVVMTNQDLSVVKNPSFQALMHGSSGRKKVPSPETLLHHLILSKNELQEKVSIAARDQHVSISAGVWRRTYPSAGRGGHVFLNLNWIDDSWKLVGVGLDCIALPTTPGEPSGGMVGSARPRDRMNGDIVMHG
ncbi:unnamed protein product, partial [Discosporangium mesarthrocarpum]